MFVAMVGMMMVMMVVIGMGGGDDGNGDYGDGGGGGGSNDGDEPDFSGKQQRILGKSSTVPYKPALSLFLSTLRLKLLEDSSLDTDPELGPGKDSGATDGKGEGLHSYPLQMRAAVCQVSPL